MDGSYLFQPEVIAASRQFICARLISYEDKTEAEFIKSISRTGSGEQENSSFGMVAPDGKTKLFMAGRSIKGTYFDAKAMADGMNKIMESYKPKGEPAALPLTADVRIGLDVASSDAQPFVLIYAKDVEKRIELEKAMAKLAWSKDFIGHFIYASTSDAAELKPIEGIKDGAAFVVIQPDKFGLKGKVLAQTSELNELPATLTTGLKAFVREDKVMGAQLAEGRKLKLFWDTKIPVTDRGEAMARERTKSAEK